MALLVRMPIFITIELCEQIFHCKILFAGWAGEGKRAQFLYQFSNEIKSQTTKTKKVNKFIQQKKNEETRPVSSTLIPRLKTKTFSMSLKL